MAITNMLENIIFFMNLSHDGNSIINPIESRHTKKLMINILLGKSRFFFLHVQKVFVLKLNMITVTIPIKLFFLLVKHGTIWYKKIFS